MSLSVTHDLRTEIEELAGTAQREFAERERELARRAPGARKRLSGILWAGGILAALEAGFLVFQLAVTQGTPTEHPKAHPLLNAQTCAGERYRTFQALIRYRKDFGRWPATLADVVGPYLSNLPVDPTTGLPLVYERHGGAFSLDCLRP